MNSTSCANQKLYAKHCHGRKEKWHLFKSSSDTSPRKEYLIYASFFPTDRCGEVRGELFLGDRAVIAPGQWEHGSEVRWVERMLCVQTAA